MSNRPVILCVDDEKNIVESIRLNLRGRYEVLTALSAKEGLEVIAERGDVSVVVSDMRMPETDGAAFLAEVRSALPYAVRVLLTGYSDIEAAMRAVNEGQIFRFLTKPCPPDQLLTTLDACVEQHKLMTAERVLLQKTLIGCVKALVDVLALSNPMALGRASRIRDRARHMARHLKVTQSWRVEFTALLSQLGVVALADDTIRKLYDGDALEVEEVNKLVEGMGSISQILANIPRMEPVIELLNELTIMTGEASLDNGSSSRSLESRILQGAIELDAHEARGLSLQASLSQLEGRKDVLGNDVLAAIASLAKRNDRRRLGEVRPADLADGMILCEDLKTTDGVVIMPRGFAINQTSREHISKLAASLPCENIRVLIPSADARPPEIGAVG